MTRLAKAVGIVALIVAGLAGMTWLMWATQGKAYWLIALGPIIAGCALAYSLLGGQKE